MQRHGLVLTLTRLCSHGITNGIIRNEIVFRQSLIAEKSNLHANRNELNIAQNIQQFTTHAHARTSTQTVRQAVRQAGHRCGGERRTAPSTCIETGHAHRLSLDPKVRFDGHVIVVGSQRVGAPRKQERQQMHSTVITNARLAAHRRAWTTQKVERQRGAS